MATTLPSPPATPPPASTPSPPSSDLAFKLDTLLESYLNLLDTYTTLRAQLSSEFASGFLSLAHANRNAASVLGAGRRFGQEGYDERMKAIRGVRIQRMSVRPGKMELKVESELEENEDQQLTEDPKPANVAGKGKEKLASQENPDADVSKRNAQHEHRNHPEEDSTKVSETSNDSQTASVTSGQQLNPAPADIDAEHYEFSVTDGISCQSSETKPRDPLLWFTALPPQALRQTQSHFTSTITTTIPQLLTTISKMEILEKRIWDVRGQMGILHEYQKVPAEHSENIKKDESISNQTDRGSGKDLHDKHTTDLRTASAAPAPTVKESKENLTLPPPSKRQSLVSRARPSEPRSRVLKLD